jgi:hypothetical protein
MSTSLIRLLGCFLTKFILVMLPFVGEAQFNNAPGSYGPQLITGNETITGSGTLTWDELEVTGTGTLTIPVGVTLVISGKFENIGNIIVNGTLQLNGASNEVTSTGTISGSGTLQSDEDIENNGSIFGSTQNPLDCSGGCSDPLPVELVNFAVSLRANGAFLKWQTATELNNSHFEVERSDNGRDFVKIGQVTGHGTTNEVKNYLFTDTKSVSNLAYYRLRQVDYDGAYEYSKIVVARANNLSGVQLSVYPNPASDRMYIQLSGPASFNRLELMDIGGRTVADIKDRLNEHSFLAEVPLTGLVPGMYLIHYQTVTNESGAVRVVVK